MAASIQSSLSPVYHQITPFTKEDLAPCDVDCEVLCDHSQVGYTWSVAHGSKQAFLRCFSWNVRSAFFHASAGVPGAPFEATKLYSRDPNSLWQAEKQEKQVALLSQQWDSEAGIDLLVIQEGDARFHELLHSTLGKSALLIHPAKHFDELSWEEHPAIYLNKRAFALTDERIIKTDSSLCTAAIATCRVTNQPLAMIGLQMEGLSSYQQREVATRVAVFLKNNRSIFSALLFGGMGTSQLQAKSIFESEFKQVNNRRSLILPDELYPTHVNREGHCLAQDAAALYFTKGHCELTQLPLEEMDQTSQLFVEATERKIAERPLFDPQGRIEDSAQATYTLKPSSEAAAIFCDVVAMGGASSDIESPGALELTAALQVVFHCDQPLFDQVASSSCYDLLRLADDGGATPEGNFPVILWDPESFQPIGEAYVAGEDGNKHYPMILLEENGSKHTFAVVALQSASPTTEELIQITKSLKFVMRKYKKQVDSALIVGSWGAPASSVLSHLETHIHSHMKLPTLKRAVAPVATGSIPGRGSFSGMGALYVHYGEEEPELSGGEPALPAAVSTSQ